MSASKLVKLTLFVHRKPYLSVKDFENYWTHKHPKALSAFNDKLDRPIRRYIQCHRNPASPSDGAGEMEKVFGKDTELNQGYEAVVEVWFDSIERMVETYTHPLYAKMVSPDEAKFGAGPMEWTVSSEVVQWDHTT